VIKSTQNDRAVNTFPTRRSSDLDGLEELARQAVDSLDAYLSATVGERRVAYFSAEFGIHECLPLYSGGLGVLAGDHLKSASDLRSEEHTSELQSLAELVCRLLLE